MLRGSSRGCPQQVVRVGLVDFGERHRHTDERAALAYTAVDRWPTNQVSAWQAGRGSRRTRPTRTTSCGHPRRGRHEDSMRKKIPWNLSFTELAEHRLGYNVRYITAMKI